MSEQHPKVRAFPFCPLCLDIKDQGLLMCWPCFRVHKHEEDTSPVNARLDRLEKGLHGFTVTVKEPTN